MRVLSPVVAGSGALVLHRTLEHALDDYQVHTYSPILEYFPPPLLFFGRRQPADLIHAPLEYGWFFHRQSTPMVLTVHNYVLDTFMRRYSTWLQRLHYRTDLQYLVRRSAACADSLVSVSHYTAALVQRELGLSRPIKVIYNGIDTTRFVPGTRTDKTVRVLFSGNLSIRKGAHLLPDIARHLAPNVELLYTRGLRRGGLSVYGEHLVDLGPILHEDMPALYRSVDLVLLPTVREGLSLAVLEAMACGLPVVATDIASLPEQIVDGQGGYLCPLGDTAAFAERINELADNPRLRRRMGEFNRCRVEQTFTIERMVSEYKQVFEGLVRP